MAALALDTSTRRRRRIPVRGIRHPRHPVLGIRRHSAGRHRRVPHRHRRPSPRTSRRVRARASNATATSTTRPASHATATGYARRSCAASAGSLHRIWGTAWYRDRNGEENKLRAAIEHAAQHRSTGSSPTSLYPGTHGPADDPVRGRHLRPGTAWATPYETARAARCRAGSTRPARAAAPDMAPGSAQSLPPRARYTSASCTTAARRLAHRPHRDPDPRQHRCGHRVAGVIREGDFLTFTDAPQPPSADPHRRPVTATLSRSMTTNSPSPWSTSSATPDASA